ncbi:hypothetical protein EDB84DRAFT_1239632, partial [Lactarius hengduanensis]
YGAPFHPDNSHIRCLAHVVNIVVQKILSVAKEVDDPEIQDYYERLNKQFPVHYDLGEDEELQDFENEDDSANGVLNDLNDGLIDQETGEQDGFTAMSIIEKQEGGGDTDCDIDASPGCSNALEFNTCNDKTGAHTSKGELLHFSQWECTSGNVAHARGWSSVGAARPVHVCVAIDSWLFEFEELRGILLTSREWDLLGQYEELLQSFTEVTAIISRSSMPTLPWVLPMYELMREHLVKFMDDDERPLAIREAACAGHEKLMQYYGIGRRSMHIIVATICHPALRTDWFLKLSDGDHTYALTVFRHVYEEYASRFSPPEDGAATHDKSDTDSDSGILGSAAARPLVEHTHSKPESPSEFTRWVTNEGGGGKMNYPLVWWKV